MRMEITMDKMRIISSEHTEYKNCIKELIFVAFKLGYGLEGEFNHLTKHLTDEDKVDLVTRSFKLDNPSLKQAIYVLFDFEEALSSSRDKVVLFNRVMAKLTEVDRKFDEFQEEFLIFLDSKKRK